MVQLLLDAKSTISQNSDGLTCLDLAVLGRHFDVCRTIVEHASWKSVVGNEKDVNGTFKRMIRHLPEAALLVLDVR